MTPKLCVVLLIIWKLVENRRNHRKLDARHGSQSHSLKAKGPAIMSSARVDFVIERGATFERELMWTDSAGTPITMTGLYTAKMQIRETYTSPTALITLTSSPAAGLTIAATAGKLIVRIGADLTELLTITSGVYDLELTKIGDVTQVVRLIEGFITVSPQVTL